MLPLEIERTEIMGKKHHENHEQDVAPEGGNIQADQPTENVEQSTTSEVQTPEEQPEQKVTFGIGQFVRHLLKNTNKSNKDVLELVLTTFPGSKTTPACIAWYKTDMRKKGLLPEGTSRGAAKLIELSAEELAELCK